MDIPTSPVDSQQAANFAALAGAKADWTSLPKGLTQAVASVTRRAGFKLAGDQIREVTTSAGKRAWLVPGGGSMCLGAENTDGIGVACVSTADAIAGKLAIIEHATDGGEDTVIGLSPNKVASVAEVTGKERSSGAQSNVYVLKGRELADLRLQDSSGASVGRVNVPKN